MYGIGRQYSPQIDKERERKKYAYILVGGVRI